MCNQLIAQNALKYGIEIRPRALIDEGYLIPKAYSDPLHLYISQRSRIWSSLGNEKVESYLAIQDVRLWGDDDSYRSTGSYGNSASISLHQAWVKLNISPSFYLKTGRQLFSYDDQRVISSRNWNDYQVSYDAFLIAYEHARHRIHLALSYNVDNKSAVNYPSDKFRIFDFVHYKNSRENLTWSGLILLTAKTRSDTSEVLQFKSTYGSNLNLQNHKSKIHMGGYFQHQVNDPGQKILAFCLTVNLERQINKKLSFDAGSDYLSGNSVREETDHRFDILYGRRHAFYGYMDYFSIIPEEGLQDYHIGCTYLHSTKLNTALDFHQFYLAETLTNTDTNNSHPLPKDLGREFDFMIRWNPYNYTQLECGYSFFLTTATLKCWKGLVGESLCFAQFFYLMLTVSIDN